MSPEIDNFKKDPDKTAADGNAMLRALCAGLNDIARKAGLGQDGKVPVAISAYYRESTVNMNEQDYWPFLRTTLDGSGITHLIFQDSVGVSDTVGASKAGLDDKEIEALRRRYDAVIKIGQGLGFETWADVEVFVGEKASEGAKEGRVRDQLTAASACARRIVFSTNNHLSAFATRPNTAALFQGLYRWLAGKAYNTPPPTACEAP
jgi:hypothetical protein